MFQLRAAKTDESNSIIIAFHAQWQEALETSDISVVFRKFGPRNYQPSWIYAYLTKPTSAIVAKLQLTSCEHVDVEDAAAFAEQGMMTRQEVIDYGARFSKLYVFHIGRILMARSPITFRYLVDEYGYWPDSTFIPLTPDGERILDTLGDFGE